MLSNTTSYLRNLDNGAEVGASGHGASTLAPARHAASSAGAQHPPAWSHCEQHGVQAASCACLLARSRLGGEAPCQHT